MDTIQLCDDNRNQFTCYAIDDNSVLIDVTPPNEVYLNGILNVKVVYGFVDLMGYKLTPKNTSVTVYSVKEYCLLKITSRENETRPPIDEHYLSTFNICGDISRVVLSQFSTTSQLILISKHEELKNILQFLDNYELPLFVRDDFEKPIRTFFPVNTSKYYGYQECREWNATTDVILSRNSAKTVVCGEKDVGKSTLLRYLVNRSLNTWEQVLVIDFDPGQCEFTVPGCLSATVIRSPLLGPNFSHSFVPAKCLYLGTVDVMSSLKQYTNYITELIDYCYAHLDTGIPWFVNTMGFIEGAGIELLLHITDRLSPTDIIQIRNSKKEGCNLYSRLSSSAYGVKRKNVNARYQLHSFPSFVRSVHNQKSYFVGRVCSPPIQRNITMLFYFRRIMKDISSANLLAVIPQSLSLNNVKIVVEKPSSHEIPISLTKFQSLCSINAKLVAFCVTYAPDDTLHCIGHGIVRGFDPATDELYIITPVDKDQLSTTTVICANLTIQLPESVFKNRKLLSDGPVPYVMRKRVDKFNEKTKKSTSRLKYRRNREDR